MSKSYESLFIDFLKDAIAECTGVVQQSQALLSDELREQAWHVLSYALKDSSLWTQTRDLVLNLAPKMEQAGFRNDWMGYLESGIHQAEMHDDHAAIAEFELQVALLQRMLSNYDVAVQWLEKSYQHFRHAGDKRGQARVYNELAWVEQLRRNYDVASQQVEQALVLLNPGDSEFGMSYRVQGMIAIYQGKWQKAEALHRKALAVFEQNLDQRKVAWSIQNIGFSLRGQERHKESIKCFLEATTLMSDLRDLYHLAIAQANLGLAYYFSNLPDEAVIYLLEAEAKFAHFHDKLQLARVYTNLGLVYLMNGLNEQASLVFKSSIQFYHELGLISLVINAMDGLAASYIAQKQHQSAAEVINKAISLLPQVISEPNYSYLVQSLNNHLQQTHNEHSVVFVAKASNS